MVHWRREWQTTSEIENLENPMDNVKIEKRYDIERWTPQVGRCPICYWRRVEKKLQKNEEMEPKRKKMPSCGCDWWKKQVRCCKEQYCIGTWNVKSMNQCKLEVVKQEMARVKTDILGISELKWIRMGKFNSMTIIPTTVGKNPLEDMVYPS